MSPPKPYTADYRVIPAPGVKSLVWMAGKLLDWVSGVVEYDLEGTKRGPSISYPYRFDAAVVSPSGSHVALYERLGVAREGVLRDEFIINGSYVDDIVMAKALQP